MKPVLWKQNGHVHQAYSQYSFMPVINYPGLDHYCLGDPGEQICKSAGTAVIMFIQLLHSISHVHIRRHICTFTCIYLCIHVCILVYVCVNMFVYVPVYMSPFSIPMFIRMCVYVYILVVRHTYIYVSTG